MVNEWSGSCDMDVIPFPGHGDHSRMSQGFHMPVNPIPRTWGSFQDFPYKIQPPQLGHGLALLAAKQIIAHSKDVLLLGQYCDGPFDLASITYTPTHTHTIRSTLDLFFGCPSAAFQWSMELMSSCLFIKPASSVPQSHLSPLKAYHFQVFLQQSWSSQKLGDAPSDTTFIFLAIDTFLATAGPS